MDFPGREPGTGQAGSKFSIISFVLLLLLIVSIAFLVYIKSKNGDTGNINIAELIKSGFSDKGEKSPAERLISQIEYDSKEHPVFVAYKDSIIKASKDNIMCLNKQGEVLWTKSVTVNNPLVKVSGSNLLVADLNGRFFYVINGKDIRWDQKVDGNIVSADINQKGYITIIKEMKGYKGAVEVYDPQGNWVFTSAKGENFVISAKVLPSCDGVVVNMLDTSGVGADTKFEFINMSGKTVSSLNKNGAIFPAVWTLSGDNVAAVNDSAAMIFDDEKNVILEQEYERVYSSIVSSGKNIILAVKQNNGKSGSGAGKTTVNIVNGSGKTVSDYYVDGEVVNLKSYGSSVAVNTGREVYFINSKGKLIGKYTSKTDILEVEFFNKDEAAVITKNNIVVTKIY